MILKPSVMAIHPGVSSILADVRRQKLLAMLMRTRTERKHPAIRLKPAPRKGG